MLQLHKDGSLSETGNFQIIPQKSCELELHISENLSIPAEQSPRPAVMDFNNQWNSLWWERCR